MAATKLDLVVNQGSTLRRRIAFLSKKSSQPIDLTGCEIHAGIRETPSSKTLLAKFDYYIPDPISGIVTILVPADITRDFPIEANSFNDIATYFWDCKLKYSDGTIDTYFYGEVIVTPGVDS